jgi:uncharacterized protein
MQRLFAALAAGSLFGMGLAVSRMVDPARVLGFLDFAGAWDPSLAFVMAGALGTTWAGYRIALRRPKPVFAEQFILPTRRDIDARLIAGAVTFGIGWGLAGFCPGPALASLAYGNARSLLFVAAMACGMGLYRIWPAESR